MRLDDFEDDIDSSGILQRGIIGKSVCFRWRWSIQTTIRHVLQGHSSIP